MTNKIFSKASFSYMGKITFRVVQKCKKMGNVNIGHIGEYWLLCTETKVPLTHFVI